ncbi:MAG: hypothetical protein M1826_003279 [Phylliscum demangeonii]|nr:MAG: hypothetical protein M1826_003279 [Phylliscum demangeonii]
MRSCIRRNRAWKYDLSADQVNWWFIERCAMNEGESRRESCAARAETHFAGRANQGPFGLRAQVQDGYRRTVHTGRAVFPGTKRTTGRLRTWAQSKFGRPVAFQTSAVRENEAAGAMHPLGPILVGE